MRKPDKRLRRRSVPLWPFLAALLPLVLVLPAARLAMDGANGVEVYEYQGVLRREGEVVSVGVPAGLRLTEVMLSRGDHVFAGQTIALADAPDTTAALQAARQEAVVWLAKLACGTGSDTDTPALRQARTWQLHELFLAQTQACELNEESRALELALAESTIRKLEERERIISRALAIVQQEQTAGTDLPREDLRRALDLTMTLNLLRTDLEKARAEAVRITQNHAEEDVQMQIAAQSALPELLSSIARLENAQPHRRIIAPIGGTIADIRPEVLGKVFQARVEVATIDPGASRLLVQFELPQADLSRVGLGDVARVHLTGGECCAFEGRLSSVSRAMDQGGRLIANIEVPVDEEAGDAQFPLRAGSAVEVGVRITGISVKERVAQLIAAQGRLAEVDPFAPDLKARLDSFVERVRQRLLRDPA